LEEKRGVHHANDFVLGGEGVFWGEKNWKNVFFQCKMYFVRKDIYVAFVKSTN
jgi:hypothetical protein